MKWKPYPWSTDINLPKGLVTTKPLVDTISKYITVKGLNLCHATSTHTGDTVVYAPVDLANEYAAWDSQLTQEIYEYYKKMEEQKMYNFVKMVVEGTTTSDYYIKANPIMVNTLDVHARCTGETVATFSYGACGKHAVGEIACALEAFGFKVPNTPCLTKSDKELLRAMKVMGAEKFYSANAHTDWTSDDNVIRVWPKSRSAFGQNEYWTLVDRMSPELRTYVNENRRVYIDELL